jgi:16S rRNA processing protein RimM
MTENHIRVGTIVATWGTAGDVVLRHNLGKRSDFKGIEVFFIEVTKDGFLPYFIKQVKVKTPEEVLVLFDAVPTKEKAQSLLKKSVWLPESQAKKLAASSAPVKLLGYTVVDSDKPLGIVEEVIEQPLQILLRITIDNKEVLVPLNESTIISIDHKKKLVNLNLPEGLLEVYLG